MGIHPRAMSANFDLIFDWRFVGRTAVDGRELMESNGLQVAREFRAQEGAIVVYECVPAPSENPVSDI